MKILLWLAALHTPATAVPNRIRTPPPPPPPLGPNRALGTVLQVAVPPLLTAYLLGLSPLPEERRLDALPGDVASGAWHCAGALHWGALWGGCCWWRGRQADGHPSVLLSITRGSLPGCHLLQWGAATRTRSARCCWESCCTRRWRRCSWRRQRRCWIWRRRVCAGVGWLQGDASLRHWPRPLVVSRLSRCL